MTGYDYGNARLRAMKSRLLTEGSIYELAAAGSLDQLIVLLTQTPYRSSLEAALAQTTGLRAIELGLRQNLVRSMQRIRNFYKDQEQHLVAVILRAYDVENLKAILRGLANRATPAEMLSAMLPVGDVPEAALTELASAPNLNAAVDLLATMREPIARPLLDQRFQGTNSDVARMETALERWYCDELEAFIMASELKNSLFEEAFKLEADFRNVVAVIHEVTSGDKKDRRAGERPTHLLEGFAGFGHLSLAILSEAAQQTSLADAIRKLANAAYREMLLAGLEAVNRTGRASDMERQFRRYRLRWLSHLPGRDPLGPGMILAFVALKISEIGNLRWIAHGIDVGLSPPLIQQELEPVL